MKNNVAKRILNIVVDIVMAIIVVFAVVVAISTITAKSNGGVPDLFGYSPFSVQTESMEPTLVPGDYIFVKACDSDSLQKGDIITFFTMINDQKAINTHRIVDVIREGDMLWYQTQGDNKETNPDPDEELVAPGDVIGKYTGMKIPVLGAVMTFLSSTWGFFFVIVLPVLLFTVYQVIKLIRAIMYNKKVEMVTEAAEGTSEEVRDAIIAEYLAKQKSADTDETASDTENEAAPSTDGEDTAE